MKKIIVTFLILFSGVTLYSKEQTGHYLGKIVKIEYERHSGFLGLSIDEYTIITYDNGNTTMFKGRRTNYQVGQCVYYSFCGLFELYIPKDCKK